MPVPKVLISDELRPPTPRPASPIEKRDAVGTVAQSVLAKQIAEIKAPDARPKPWAHKKCAVVRFFSMITYYIGFFFRWLFGYVDKGAKKVVDQIHALIRKANFPLPKDVADALITVLKLELLPRPATLAAEGNRAGIVNIGNNCYMNTALQLIASSSAFDPMLTDEPLLPNLDEPLDPVNDSLEIQAIKNQLASADPEARAVIKRECVAELERSNDLIKLLQQQLAAIIHKIRTGERVEDKEMNYFYFLLLANGWGPEEYKAQIDMDEFLNWLLYLLPSKPTFTLVNQCMNEKEPVWHTIGTTKTSILQLPLPKRNSSKPASLTSLKTAALGAEFLSPKDGFVRTRLEGKPPRSLVVLLKRFCATSTGKTWRYKGPIALFANNGEANPLELSFGERKVTYRLQAVGLHTGAIRGGHYRALVRNENGFAVMNDDYVQTRDDFAQDANDNCYVTVYELDSEAQNQGEAS